MIIQKGIIGTDGAKRTEAEHIRWLVKQEVTKQLHEMIELNRKSFDEELTKRENALKHRKS